MLVLTLQLLYPIDLLWTSVSLFTSCHVMTLPQLLPLYNGANCHAYNLRQCGDGRSL